MSQLLRTHVLYEPPTEALAKWVCEMHARRFANSDPARMVPLCPGTLPFRESLAQDLDDGAAHDPSLLHLCIVVLWNGTDPVTQTDLQGVRDYITQAHVKGCRVSMQAINAKQGTHNFYKEDKGSPKLLEVESNIFEALSKKVHGMELAATEGTGGGAGGVAPPKRDEIPTVQAAPADAIPEGPMTTPEDITGRMSRCQGEFIYSCSAPNAAEFQESMQNFKSLCVAAHVVCTPVWTKDDNTAAEILCRALPPAPLIDMRVAVCGNVDSGKSTLTSVLTRQQYDDGRGLARAKVFNHKHEQDTGRTSSISEQYLAYDEKGGVVNFYTGAISKEELKEKSRKIITFFDLAGHERYLKTTVLGMTRSVPDYAVIVVSANNGIQRMTKEHLALCLALKIPFFVVVTRVDATPDNVRIDTVNTIVKMLRHPSVRKLPLMVRRMEDAIIGAKNMKADRVTPVIEVSNVTGLNLDLLYVLLNLVPSRYDWGNAMLLPSSELVVDSTFYVTGVGTVVGGIVTQGSFKVGDNVVLGPDGNGHFRQTQVKSIHSKGLDVPFANAGSDATLALKKEKKSNIRKGMVVLGGDAAATVIAYWEFEAEVVILYHSTTISNNYEPVIHSATVRQSARIQLTDREVLRTGDKARVRFRFLYRPEFIKVGQKLVFREGRTKGLGTVTQCISDPAPPKGGAPPPPAADGDGGKKKGGK